MPIPNQKLARWVGLALGLALLMLALPTSRSIAGGPAIRVKLASLAPEGSPWDDMLREIDKEWRKLSDGQVSLKIYPNGVLGNETQLVKKMKIGQIHAALLTSAGIGDFDPGALTIQIPGLIQSYEGLDYVMARVSPTLDQRMAAKGFVSLGWGEAGWARFFTKNPVNTPDDLKKTKLYAWEGDPKMVRLLKDIGLNPVVLPSTEMLPSLQTGRVEGMPTTALAALSYQWFGIANHMVDIKWSPLIGALVIDQRTWNKIPPQLQGSLIAASRRITAKYKGKIREKDTKAIQVMESNGLTVHTPTDLEAWSRFQASTHPLLRGDIWPEDLFDLVVSSHEAFKAQEAVQP